MDSGGEFRTNGYLHYTTFAPSPLHLTARLTPLSQLRPRRPLERRQPPLEVRRFDQHPLRGAELPERDCEPHINRQLRQPHENDSGRRRENEESKEAPMLHKRTPVQPHGATLNSGSRNCYGCVGFLVNALSGIPSG